MPVLPGSSFSSSSLSSSLSFLRTAAADNLKHFTSTPSMIDLDGGSSAVSPRAQPFNSSSGEECDELTVQPALGNVVICYGCGFEIKQKYMMKVEDQFWHENCLVCCSCRIPLNDSTCYSRNGQLYCKQDYAIKQKTNLIGHFKVLQAGGRKRGSTRDTCNNGLFGAKCVRCGVAVQCTDYVYRVFTSIYHAHCFTCFCCGHLFKKGDRYLLLDGQVICSADYEHLLCQAPICQSHLYYDQNDSNRKTPKRPRTILNTQQRKAFKLAFEKTSKPCRKVREQLAKETNLSVRVVQVWFQNQRAKMKKIQRKQEVSKTNGGAACSETDAKSNDDSKSNCDSADDSDSENDDTEVDDLGSSEEKAKESSNPIAQLFHMHTTYFLA